jgi:hypothetical protein
MTVPLAMRYACAAVPPDTLTIQRRIADSQRTDTGTASGRTMKKSIPALIATRILRRAGA